MICCAPPLGAQATPRTHPECGAAANALSKDASASIAPDSSTCHTLTTPSHPPETSLGTEGTSAAAGAQDTALQPIWCALGTTFSSQLLSAAPRQVSTESVPSADAHARRRPCSCGAKQMAFTEERWSAYSYTLVHCPGAASRQTKTLRSYEHVARMVPNLGCAHATCHTGPSWPVMLAVSVCCPGSGPSSKILTTRSEEQVARRLP
mmetsp:Transcript_28011/g.69296  ORF Transcript_28011/g.69296 Transcript_28011/m.69296 type:complete len:207 (+) Transcript_28011:149-769(+)